jgi:trans-2-enoyl-CoA reductase
MKEEGIHEGCMNKFNACIKKDCILVLKSPVDESEEFALMI